jgi:hypothetical protein
MPNLIWAVAEWLIGGLFNELVNYLNQPTINFDNTDPRIHIITVGTNNYGESDAKARPEI